MTNLEKLLLKINDVKTLTEQQVEETLKTALQDETKKFITESLNEKDKLVKEDVDNDYTEEVVGDSLPAATDSMDLDAGEDEGSGGPDEMPMSDSMPTDSGMDASPMPDTTGDDDEVLDLSNATVEEVLAQLEKLPDNTVIEIKKNAPTYSVSTETGEGDETMTESADKDKDDECNECLDEEVDKWIEESLKEEASIILTQEYKVMLEEYEQKLAKIQTESDTKIKDLESKLVGKTQEIKTLSEQQEKYNEALTKATEFLDEMTVRNTNLLHITKLFTEQTVSKDDKIKIAKQFDDVKTINESSILYKALSETLPKAQKLISKEIETMKEEILGKKEVLKEEKTFNDPEFERFEQLMAYKI